MSIKIKALLCLLAAAALGAVTLAIVGYLGPSGVRDGLSMPGAVLGVAGSVVGLYDIPSGTWAAACMIGNLIFYTGLWWTLIWVFVRRNAAAQR